MFFDIATKVTYFTINIKRKVALIFSENIFLIYQNSYILIDMT